MFDFMDFITYVCHATWSTGTGTRDIILCIEGATAGHELGSKRRLDIFLQELLGCGMVEFLASTYAVG